VASSISHAIVPEYVNFQGFLTNTNLDTDRALIWMTKLKSIKALKSLIILDTCHSGLLAENTSDVMLAKRRSGMLEKITAIEKLMRATGRSFLSSSGNKQFAVEGYKGHGVFTYALLQGLKGNADQSGKMDGIITVSELAEYLSETVPEISFQEWGYRQVPEVD